MKSFAFNRSPRALALVLTLTLVSFAPAGLLLAAEDDDNQLTGSFLIGWRSVDVNGAAGKYDQHINLADGARLFGLHLEYLPSGTFADQIKLDVDHLGGDPFESIDLQIRRHGQYKFEFSRRKSTYFYEDLLIPAELINVRLSNGGDFHSWEFDRVRDRAALDWNLSPRAKLSFELENYGKNGERTTTIDVQRDEFEFDEVIDETMNAVGVAFNYDWAKAHLMVQERVEEYDNAREIFLPGQSPGENTTDNSILDFYFLDQPTEISSHQHQATFTARPTTKFDLRASVVVNRMDLDSVPSEHSKGTQFNGTAFSVDKSGIVDISRNAELFDLDATYAVSPRFAVVASVGRRNLEQEGIGVFDVDGASRWDIETDTSELGLETALTSELTLTVGARYEQRDVIAKISETGPAELEGVNPDNHDGSTDHTGYFASLGWKPTRELRFSAELEDSSYDNPYALTSPSDRTRLRLQGQWRRQDGVFVQGTYLAHRVENKTNGWDSDFDSLSVRGGFRRDKFDGSIGYSFVDVDRSVDQNVSFGGALRLVPVFFQSESDFVDCRFRWRPMERVEFGGDFRQYDNSGDFGLERTDYRLLVDFELNQGYLLHLGLRSIDYKEKRFALNNYDADILELGVGYRF